jgi:hypothetical protein
MRLQLPVNEAAKLVRKYGRNGILARLMQLQVLDDQGQVQATARVLVSGEVPAQHVLMPEVLASGRHQAVHTGRSLSAYAVLDQSTARARAPDT